MEPRWGQFWTMYLPSKEGDFLAGRIIRSRFLSIPTPLSMPALLVQIFLRDFKSSLCAYGKTAVPPGRSSGLGPSGHLASSLCLLCVIWSLIHPGWKDGGKMDLSQSILLLVSGAGQMLAGWKGGNKCGGGGRASERYGFHFLKSALLPLARIIQSWLHGFPCNRIICREMRIWFPHVSI